MYSYDHYLPLLYDWKKCCIACSSSCGAAKDSILGLEVEGDLSWCIRYVSPMEVFQHDSYRLRIHTGVREEPQTTRKGFV